MTAVPAVSAKTRDPWLDNAKMALVTLVVVGHSWTLLPDTTTNEHLYDFLYAWHIPAFVLVTGYLSRSFSYTRTKLWRLVRTIAIPYLLFEGALAVFRTQVGGERLEDLFRDPHWPMWYLSAVFFWRLLTPLVRPLPGSLVLAVAISVVAGLWAPDTLDIARVLALLPFFVLGLKATPERLELLRSRSARVAAVGVLVGIFVLTTWTDQLARTEWLYYRARYDELTGHLGLAMLIRLVLLVVGALGAAAFLALVPRLNGWFTRMGAWTLVVYLFHGFFVKSALYAGYRGWASDLGWISLPVTTVLAVLIALVLALPAVAGRLNNLVDPLGFAEQQASDAVNLRAGYQEARAEVARLTEGTESDEAEPPPNR